MEMKMEGIFFFLFRNINQLNEFIFFLASYSANDEKKNIKLKNKTSWCM